jgi:hypothetical protein
MKFTPLEQFVLNNPLLQFDEIVVKWNMSHKRQISWHSVMAANDRICKKTRQPLAWE